jgi:hypothetical protein
VVREAAKKLKIFDFPCMASRLLGSRRVNAQFCSVGGPGLDPGTLGLKGTCELLLCVGLVDNSMCFLGNGVVHCCSGRVVLQKYEA